MMGRRILAAAAGVALVVLLASRVPLVARAEGELERGRARRAVQALLAAELGFRADHGRYSRDLPDLAPYFSDLDTHLAALDRGSLRLWVEGDRIEVTARSAHGRWILHGDPRQVRAIPAGRLHGR